MTHKKSPTFVVPFFSTPKSAGLLFFFLLLGNSRQKLYGVGPKGEEDTHSLSLPFRLDVRDDTFKKTLIRVFIKREEKKVTTQNKKKKATKGRQKMSPKGRAVLFFSDNVSTFLFYKGRR